MKRKTFPSLKHLTAKEATINDSLLIWERKLVIYQCVCLCAIMYLAVYVCVCL